MHLTRYGIIRRPLITTRTSPSTKDVLTEALAPGTVSPNASVRGYIFFKQMPDEVNQVTLDIVTD